ncbi:MAG: addiction module protein [Betaproteobacteria bacterium]|nr:addiction module protein [Betaproteobacteria bacterium]
MAESLIELEQQARALPPHDRARLAEVLLESLQGPPLSDVEAAWSREIEERITAYDRGDLQAFSAENVFAEAGAVSGETARFVAPAREEFCRRRLLR